MSAPREPLSPEATQQLARLCRLDLTPAEVIKITEDLGNILTYVDQLGELDVEGVEPTAHVQLERLPLRPDVEVPGLSRDDALAEAPRVAGDGFAVPAFVDEG
jgi:aspartyl-tRNA(Asn)/glutamyl-tRNA(Gln) amidotransferase subunit C